MHEAVSIPIVHTDRSNGYSVVRGSRLTNRPRNINLIIDNDGSTFHIRVQTRLDSFDTKKDWKDELALKPGELWGTAQIVRKAWHETAVDFQRFGVYPLQEK